MTVNFLAVGCQRVERRALRNVPRRDYPARPQGQNYRRRGRRQLPAELSRRNFFSPKFLPAIGQSR